MPRHETKRQPSQTAELSTLKTPSMLEAHRHVAPLLSGLPFRAGTGYARRGQEVSMRTLRVDHRQSLLIEIYNEKGYNLDLSGVALNISTNSKRHIVMTNEHGQAFVSKIHPEDRVTITLR